MASSKIKFGIATLACSFVFNGAANANLMVNGDFEDGLNNWEWFGFGPNTATLSSDTPSGVGSSADLDINEVLGLPWLIQDVDISSVNEGEVVTLTAWVKEVRQFQPGFDAWIAAQVYMLESSESGNILGSGAAFFTNPEWEMQSFDVEVPANANIARVLFTPQDPDFGVGTGRYLIDDVSLVVISSGSVADFDDDGDVDGDDFLIWQAGFGVDASGDADDDGDTDGDDFLIWQSEFGTGAGSQAVPEPSAALLAILLCLAYCWRRAANA